MQTQIRQPIQVVFGSAHQFSIPLIKEEEHDWLSEKFDRLPYKIYKFWLILSFGIVGVIGYQLMNTFWHSLDDDRDGFSFSQRYGLFVTYDLCTIMRIVSFSLLSYGSARMLLAMSQRKSQVAQKSCLKFQYSLLILVTCFVLEIQLNKSEFLGKSALFQWISTNCALMMIPAIHLLGGFVILGVFKKNHPLAKQDPKRVLDDSTDKDFLEQNEAIAAELAKYDERLETKGYLIYKWWIKFVITFEFIRLSQQVLYLIGDVINYKNFDFLAGHMLLITSYLLSFWSGLATEVAITMKMLPKSIKGILLLKVCIAVSIITDLLLLTNPKMSMVEGLHISLSFLINFACCGLIPIITLIGALGVKAIIEQREKFANLSSFTNESYL